MLTTTLTTPAARPAAPFALIRRLRAHLQALASLTPLSAAHLRDIGLIRSDIEALRSLSLSADVSTRLQISAARRSGNW